MVNTDIRKQRKLYFQYRGKLYVSKPSYLPNATIYHRANTLGMKVTSLTDISATLVCNSQQAFYSVNKF